MCQCIFSWHNYVIDCWLLLSLYACVHPWGKTLFIMSLWLCENMYKYNKRSTQYNWLKIKLKNITRHDCFKTCLTRTTGTKCCSIQCCSINLNFRGHLDFRPKIAAKISSNIVFRYWTKNSWVFLRQWPKNQSKNFAEQFESRLIRNWNKSLCKFKQWFSQCKF